MTFYEQQQQQAAADIRSTPSFWEIFKHSWPVFKEKPKALGVLVLILSVLYLAVDLVTRSIFQPFDEALNVIMTSSLDREQMLAVLKGAAADVGWGKLSVGVLLPWLLTPFTGLAVCQAALNLWDGYDVTPSDLGFVLANYFRSLLVIILVMLFGFFLGLALLAAWLPFSILFGLSRRTGVGQGTAFLLAVGGLAVGVVVFARYLWPMIRRFLVLEYVTFFAMVDGFRGGLPGKMTEIYRGLKDYPRHLNQAILIFVMLIVSVLIAAAVVNQVLMLLIRSDMVAVLVNQIVFLLAMTYVMLTLAGFYRLSLAPLDYPDGGGESAPPAPGDPGQAPPAPPDGGGPPHGPPPGV